MNGHSYPEVAAHAVANAYQQHPSPVFGYLRSGYQQKIYLYNTLDDARGWFTSLVHGQQPFDYAAVFASPEFSRAVQGLESFGPTNVSGDPYVGNWLPFVLGLPLGGLAGYFLRSWQEGHPGQALPGIPPGTIPPPRIPAPGAPPPAPPPPSKTSGDPYGYGYSVGCPDMVGGPWVDMVGPQVGGPWVDIVGAYQYGSSPSQEAARLPTSRATTRALIQAAIDDVTSQAFSYPAEAWVWSLSTPGPSYGGSSPGSYVTLTPQSMIVPFSSRAQALDYLRQVAQTRPLATAMFERSFRWPNPTAWHKSDDPEHAALIADYVASKSSARTVGDYATAAIGAAIDDVRERAKSIANKRAGNVVGVIHTSKDDTWHALAFRNEDDADDWITLATQTPSTYTYAAYFDKQDATWPNPVIENVSGMRAPPGTALPRRSVSGDSIGATARTALEGFREQARQRATSHTPRGSAAAGVINTADGMWHALGFKSLDDAIDWLQAATREKTSFTYAAAFEKDSDGNAYFQAEEIGERRRAPQAQEVIPRDIATTSGDDYDYGYAVGGPWVNLHGWAA